MHGVAHTDNSQLLGITSNTNEDWQSHPPTCRYRIRLIRSKPAIYLLVMNFLLLLTFPAQIKNIYLVFLGEHEYLGSLFNKILLATYIVATVAQLSYILLSCISDTCCGRFKAIKCGFGMTCFGLLSYILATIFVIIYFLVLSVQQAIPKAFLIIAAVVAIVGILTVLVGILIVYVNVLQVSLEQLQKGSNEEVGAYIHWFVWTEALGLAIYSVLVNVASSCGETAYANVTIVITSLQVVVFLACGISWWCFSKRVRNYFPYIQIQTSPFTIVRLVVKYALSHRRPRTQEPMVQQEAMLLTGFSSGSGVETHVETLSRLDYAKDVHGGPFTSQQVEDVKSCGRLFIVVLSISAIFLLNIPTSMVASIFTSHIQQGDDTDSCSAKSVIVSSFSSLLPVILIPLYELVIHPLFGHYVPASPKKIGLGMILLTVSLLFYFITDTVGHSKNTVACMFEDSSVEIDIEKNIILLPNILNVLAYLLIQIGGLEFICSQSPTSMRGVLIAVFLGIRGVFWILGLVLVAPFWTSADQFSSVSCGFGYYLLNIILTSIVIAISCVVACWYTKWQRRQAEENPTSETTL